MPEQTLIATNLNRDVGSANIPLANSKTVSDGNTPKEQQVVNFLRKIFDEAKRHRQFFDAKWNENFKFFRGKQWKDKRPSYRHSEVLNYIFAEIQNVLVLLTDNRPQIEIRPEDPSDFEFAEILSQIIKSKWDINNWSYVLAEAIMDSSIYGTALSSVEWKRELFDGLGDFVFETVDPFYFYPDPNARSKVNDEYMNYVITAIPTDLHEVQRRYPKKAKFIKPDLTNLNAAFIGREEFDEIRLRSPSDNRVLVETQRPENLAKPDQVLLVTAYLNSAEMEEQEVAEKVDESGSVRRLFQQKKKFPNGRKVVMANGILLEDGPNPYINGKFPYARLADHILPREFWGVGEVEQLKCPQQIVNKLVSYMLDVLTITGNPIWVVDTSSGIETNNLTNQPGLVVEKNPGSEVRREQGVNVQPFVMDAFNIFTERVLQKLGSTGDISQGVAPSANLSGFAIEQLQEASQTKLRGKGRNLEAFLRDVGDLMVDRIIQFYTIPRIIRLTENEQADRFFKFFISEKSDESGELQKVATVQEFEQDPSTGEFFPGAPREVFLKSRLDARISVGSQLVGAKAQRAARAERLFDKGVIDEEELLTQIEYPNVEKVLERLKQRKEQQAQVEAATPQGVQ